MGVFIIQSIVMLILAFIIYYLVMYNKAVSLEKRIARYSVDSIKNSKPSLFDSISNDYKNLIKSFSKSLSKSVLLKNYSSRYNKYVTYDMTNTLTEMDYVSNKFMIMFSFLFLLCFSGIIKGDFPNILNILMVSLVGFYVLDIFLKLFDYRKKKQIEEELLNAIIIMNNAFRSGRSTIQAIEIVANELKGPIKQEFKKMKLEISYGLSLEVVFDRFSKRVDLEEVNYITSSLSILNKTGGNIINVFSSIEKMLFNKKKIKEEMKSLTSSARMISKILIIMPFIFVMFIFILNPDYFTPLISNPLGNMILIFILMIYAIYIYVVNRILKVEV